MKKGKFAVLGLASLMVFPVVAHGISDFAGLVNFITDTIIMSLIKLIGALATLFFLWGVMKFIKDADNPAKRAEGQQFILYGLIGLFVMVSFYGIVRILENTFQLPTNNTSVGSSYPAGKTGSSYSL